MPAMKSRRALRAIAGVLLCVIGFALAWLPGRRFRQTTVIIDAGGCRMVTDIIDTDGDTQGSVILLHGLAANKKIMSYLAQGFALQHLRVFVPDLPGHGRTGGPFSFARAAACSDAFTHQLIARGAVDPARTVVMGHSLGGAITVIVGSRVKLAGVIALSPAPMSASRGIPAFMLPFEGPPATPANTLAISAAWEPGGIRGTAQDLIAAAPNGTGKFILVPRSSHVSVLFDSRVARASQGWTKQVLGLTQDAGSPSSSYLAGWLTGFAGLLILSGPFIRETVGPLLLPKPDPRAQRKTAEPSAPAPREFAAEPAAAIPISRALLEVGLASTLAVALLHFVRPLPGIHLFQGDYFASLLLVLGTALLILHRKQLAAMGRGLKPIILLTAAVAALMLYFLVMGWFELTVTETWLTAARWFKFPILFATVLPYHLAEELLLGPSGPLPVQPALRRLTWSLLFRLIAWGALVAAVFALHSGQIFTILLAPYFAMFCVLQRLGMGVVRKSTRSSLAAAIFGAILLAGFCLVVFPIN
jgi:pimeloyl-ACP methyl ester carboxylesterase